MNTLATRVLLPIAMNFVALAVQSFVEVVVCGQGSPQPRVAKRRYTNLAAEGLKWPANKFMG